MNERQIRRAIAKLSLGGLRFFEQTGSTNDVALAWAAAGAPDLSLVCAEEQTAGRGRGDRQWFTPAGAALAFSLILRPNAAVSHILPRFTGLAALAACQALEGLGLHPRIKWPNDILLNERKAGGILTEAVWLGERLDCIVLGVGLNVSAKSVPPRETIAFPATCIEQEASRRVNRTRLLAEILRLILDWRERIGSEAFLKAC